MATKMATYMVKMQKSGILGRRCLYALLNATNSGQYSAAFLSTLPETQPELKSIFRTSESNPINHNTNHLGQFYTVPSDVIKNAFPFQTIPKYFMQQISTFKEMCIMVRKPAVEVIKFLQNTDFTKPAIRYVLYGKRGTGKSISILHIAHYGYEKKWMLVHIPWGRLWTLDPPEYVKSQSRPGRTDLPINSAAWLQQFKVQNSALLQELDLKVTQKYEWSSREVTEEGEPLINVIDHGINRIKHSSDCLAVLLKEVKKQTESNRYKVLVMCNGINAFFYRTTMEDEQRKDILLEDVTPVRAFRKMLRNDWHNAAIAVSVDNRLKGMEKFSTPRALLGKDGFNCLDPFVPIPVENYDDKEIESCLDYYIDRLWIQSEEGKSEAGRAELKFMSSKNPRVLLEICGPL